MPDFLIQLRTAIDSLLYPSESDEPFEVITWPAAATSRAAMEANTLGRPVELLGIHAFFGELESDDQADRFAALEDLLQTHLRELEGYCVGEGSEIDIYVIGRSDGGEWLGVKTKSVET